VSGLLPGGAIGAAERIDSEVGSLWFRADDDVMRPAVRATGVWESAETRLLSRLLHPGSRFLDVGAHIGWFSVVAHRAALGVKIEAVEPDQFTARLCELNLYQAGADATVHTCALGHERDALGFVVAEHNPGDSRVGLERVVSSVVPVIPADELFRDHSFDVIKVDVQGFEAEVLLGMQRIIRRSSGLRLLMEFFPRAIFEGGTRPADVLNRYRSQGFGIQALVGDHLLEPSNDEILALCADAGPEGFLTLLLFR
jgi:FkbM family methyltransferase